MTHEPRSALLRAALDAAEQGWAVIPLRPGDKRPALHGETSCPGTGDCAGGHLKWEQRATTDPDRIRTAWATFPFNVGIATGPSDLVVVDLDMPKSNNKKDTPSGVTTFEALCERTGHPAPTTRTIRTASGGRHLYFTAPSGARLTNTAGMLGPLIDTRAWGGYVVAPGSIVRSGAYTVEDAAPVLQLPGWLLNALKPPQKPAKAVSHVLPSRVWRYATAALRYEEQNVASAPEGERNAALVRAARALGRLIASGDLTREEVEEALSRGAEAAGQQPYEYRSALTSALNWSIQHNSGSRGTA
ncbi:bifunctional DNA primase/polymerase [Streptomyces sp. NRRL S-337]|uniref:bifunctional DNA primase/polymerase n=1 Tax=Streptomyces sp. NRRL S-337 TaxID=1463900 RepID=UPI0004C71F76|nr:bifunctional DNA primase/polymerase [Streptomyces sp. NRRL S-337]